MNNKVIYTVILGDYDTLIDPVIVTPGWDYVCYTDKDVKSEIWEVVHVILDKRHIKKQSRLLKLTPPLLENYDESIYIDGNIQVNCNLNKFLLKYNPSDLMVMDHPERNNIYKEALACVELDKDNPKVILKQLDSYFSEGFNIFESGLFACGVIYRVHREEIKRLSNDWYEETKNFSHRDQLSLPYILSKHPKIVISTAPFNILKNEFIKIKHNENS